MPSHSKSQLPLTLSPSIEGEAQSKEFDSVRQHKAPAVEELLVSAPLENGPPSASGGV